MSFIFDIYKIILIVYFSSRGERIWYQFPQELPFKQFKPISQFKRLKQLQYKLHYFNDRNLRFQNFKEIASRLQNANTGQRQMRNLKKNRIVQELKCTSLAINLNRESFSENLTLSSNEKFLKSFQAGNSPMFIFISNTLLIFIISFVHMKDSKLNAKPSILKMYNVSDFYQIIDKVGRGTYGTVYKVKGLKDGRFYAIKKLQNNDAKLQQEGFPITALREISLLKQIEHPNIIKLKEIIVSRPNKRNLFRGSTFLVFQYMDHDFSGLFKIKNKFSLPQIKCIIKQLLEGVAYLHRNRILHRDIKSANILLNDQGEVKLADFGLGRKVRLQNMFTYKVVTLWYRAPQLLLGSKNYTDKIDVWSVGCVVAQFFTGEVLFKKQTQYSQMQRIYEIVGDFQTNQIKINDDSYKIYQNLQDLRPRKAYPKEIGNYFKKLCPSMSQICIDFIDRLLSLDPSKRMSCEQALRHPFFSQKPQACNKNQIQKMEYQCHEMFKDRSIKIQRFAKKDDQHESNTNKYKQSRQPRHNPEVKELRQKGKQQDRKYSKNYRVDKLYRGRQQKGRQNKFYYENRKNQNYHSSEEKSSDNRNSDSYSSSSSQSSQYSSSSKSRSRHKQRRTKEDDKRSRDQYRNRDRDSYSRRDEKRRADRKDERRDVDKFDRQRKGDFQRKEKYYKNEKDQRYAGYKDYRRKDERSQVKRQYRDERIISKKDDKVQERREDYKEDKERKDQRQRREQKQRKEEKQRKVGGDERREYRDRRQEWKKDSKQRKNQKPAYQSKSSRYYEDRDRDYKRRQQKWVQKSGKGDEAKYQETQKHGDYSRKADGFQKRYYFVSGKDPYRKKDYRHSSSSSRSSNHRYKKEKEYSRKPFTYQRKNHYKKSHSDSNDHRNH